MATAAAAAAAAAAVPRAAVAVHRVMSIHHQDQTTTFTKLLDVIPTTIIKSI